MQKLFTTLLFLFSISCWAQEFLPNGHAHNDYIHKKPLYTALEYGFASIEIDVYLHNNELIVSHLPIALSKKPTIQSVYLEPLKEIIDKNGGWVYAGQENPVILMIDFKTEASSTYEKLKEVLKPYEKYFTKYVNGEKQQGPLEILISGSKPYKEVIAEKERFATIDGSFGDLDQLPENNAVTRVSSSYGSYFKWKGRGKMPEKEMETLLALVEKTKQKGLKCRFWAIPDKENVWRTLLDVGVDWINTDKLKKFSAFYAEYKKENP